jgi:hypothetical protein
VGVNIKNPTLAQYHRNGIGGESFHEVRFTAEYDTGVDEHVIAIVTDLECYMVSLDHPDRHWRSSDYFGTILRDWIERESCNNCGGMLEHRSFCKR